MTHTMRFASAAVALWGFAAMPEPVRADDGATARFTLTIPLRCAIETVSERGTVAGTILVVDERCNGAEGYGLYLEHSADVTAIRYDGVSVTPGRGGRTLLTRVSHARDHRSRIEIVAGRGGGNIFVVMSPDT